jgi:hypothetical protein
MPRDERERAERVAWITPILCLIAAVVAFCLFFAKLLGLW